MSGLHSSSPSKALLFTFWLPIVHFELGKQEPLPASTSPLLVRLLYTILGRSHDTPQYPSEQHRTIAYTHLHTLHTHSYILPYHNLL